MQIENCEYNEIRRQMYDDFMDGNSEGMAISIFLMSQLFNSMLTDKNDQVDIHAMQLKNVLTDLVYSLECGRIEVKDVYLVATAHIDSFMVDTFEPYIMTKMGVMESRISPVLFGKQSVGKA